MNNLLRFEWYKLRHNRSFLLIFAVMLLYAVAYPIMNYMDDPGDGGALSAMTGLDIYRSGLVANEYFIKIGFGILAGFFISSEYANGTMKRSVSAGAGRTQVILSKLFVFIFGSVLISVVYPMVSFAVGSIVFGVGELPYSVSMAEYLLRTLGATALTGAAFGALTGVFATALTDSGKTIGVSFVFYFFVDYLFAVAAKYMPFMEDVYRYSIFTLVRQIYGADLAAMSPLRILAEPLLTAILFMLVCIAIFRRKEIK